ncbi:MAG: hypothetical protein WD066_03865 [Planctomycetaceae bacterium]
MSSIDIALNWAATMTWRGIEPIIRHIEGEYDRGVRISRSAFRPIANRLQRSETLPKWSLTITPESTGKPVAPGAPTAYSSSSSVTIASAVVRTGSPPIRFSTDGLRQGNQPVVAAQNGGFARNELRIIGTTRPARSALLDYSVYWRQFTSFPQREVAVIRSLRFVVCRYMLSWRPQVRQVIRKTHVFREQLRVCQLQMSKVPNPPRPVSHRARTIQLQHHDEFLALLVQSLDFAAFLHPKALPKPYTTRIRNSQNVTLGQVARGASVEEIRVFALP